LSKGREDMAAREKEDVISLSDSVFAVPRIRNTKKHAADCHFRGHKWGPATIIEVLNEKKFKVTFIEKVRSVKRWELSKTSL
jgi:hypothetical protein